MPVNPPDRAAWVEIDVAKLRKNLQLIRADIPAKVKYLAVLKDDAYGHDAVTVGQLALQAGAWGLAVSTVDEAWKLRSSGLLPDACKIVLFYERHPSEIEFCAEHGITICSGDLNNIAKLNQSAEKIGRQIPVHIEIQTGMSRYGVRWDEAMPLISQVALMANIQIEGTMTHFAKSYASDKTFAMLQLERFESVLGGMESAGISPGIVSACNSGGHLNLPHAQYDMVRSGILYTGVTPFGCRKIEGIRQVMSVKAKIAAIQKVKRGETVGYGMNYTATSERRVAVLPMGYGDGMPRLCNKGHVLIHGQKAPTLGGNSMDSMMVDVTGIPEAKTGDEAAIMGGQGTDRIGVHELAKLKDSVTYDVFTNFGIRLKKKFVNGDKI
jgi:alanine racemase